MKPLSSPLEVSDRDIHVFASLLMFRWSKFGPFNPISVKNLVGNLSPSLLRGNLSVLPKFIVMLYSFRNHHSCFIHPSVSSISYVLKAIVNIGCGIPIYILDCSKVRNIKRHMIVYACMYQSHVFRCYMPCSWYGWGSPRPRNFPVVYLSAFEKFLLAPKLDKDNMCKDDAIWSPSAYEKLVSVRV